MWIFVLANSLNITGPINTENCVALFPSIFVDTYEPNQKIRLPTLLSFVRSDTCILLLGKVF